MGNHEYGIWEEYGKYQMRTTKTKCQNAIRVIDWCKKREKCFKIWTKNCVIHFQLSNHNRKIDCDSERNGLRKLSNQFKNLMHILFQT